MSKKLSKNESARSNGELVANCDNLGQTQSHTRIEDYIHVIRGRQVIIDCDLAMLYETETRMLNKSVKRNIERFPEDFMFQLTKDEAENLMFQFGTSRWGGTRKLPYVFTENGVAMHNAQYPAIDVKIFSKSHDRFLCIDSTVYHISASIKDLGKKWFAFSILHDSTPEDLVNKIMGK